MQIEEITCGDAYGCTPHYFTAILFEGWEFWMSGPSSHIRENVLIELTRFENVKRVQLIKAYVPHVH